MCGENYRVSNPNKAIPDPHFILIVLAGFYKKIKAQNVCQKGD